MPVCIPNHGNVQGDRNSLVPAFHYLVNSSLQKHPKCFESSMGSHTVPKSLIRQKKECRHYHKVDGTDTSSRHAILEFAAMEENSDIDENADACNQLNCQLPNCDGSNNSIIPNCVVNLMV
jgi:hypothetical protein